MSKLLPALIVVIFTTASFSAAAQDNRSGLEQATAGKEASGQPAANKEAAKHKITRAGSDAKLKIAHRSSRGPLFKRRPMFK